MLDFKKLLCSCKEKSLHNYFRFILPGTSGIKPSDFLNNNIYIQFPFILFGDVYGNRVILTATKCCVIYYSFVPCHQASVQELIFVKTTYWIIGFSISFTSVRYSETSFVIFSLLYSCFLSWNYSSCFPPDVWCLILISILSGKLM